MKFGKRMRSLTTPGWEGDSVDYKLLKKTIRSLAAKCNTGVHGAAHGRTEFLAALELEMQRVNAAHERIYGELFDRDLKALSGALGNRWVLTSAQARVLLVGAIELSNQVDAFRRFILLNSLAIVKITKKFDKLFPRDLIKDIVLEDLLKGQPFYEGASMDKLCAATSSLTDRIMLCVLPDGNFRISDHKVSCPICLQTEVKSAITLSCKHTFCWSCLSKAAEHRFHSCPICRMEQSIDPRDYAIDGLLMRFKRAYDFVEDTLDRAPLAASPMRQILVESFGLVNNYLRDIEAKYAALSPRPSLHEDADQSYQPAEKVGNSFSTSSSKYAQAGNQIESDAISCRVVSSVQGTTSSEKFFTKGDAVEVNYNGEWYPGMILHENDQEAGSYSVLWWMKDQSQRFGQRMPHHLLRSPVFPEQHPAQYLLFDFAAGAWKTATEWALLPFRRLRSLSFSDTNSLQGNSSSA